jgi:hypothetical protein
LFRLLSLILIALLLTACATTSTSNYNAASPQPPLADTSVEMSTAGKVVAIVLFPIWFPLWIIANNPPSRGYRSVHCQSYTYKDAYHTKCY